jgi:cytochrome c oxidase assembly protein subunit 15
MLRRQAVTGRARTTSHILLAAVFTQVLLGIWTLLTAVPTWLGALHQAGAVALLTASLAQSFALRHSVGTVRRVDEGQGSADGQGGKPQG